MRESADVNLKHRHVKELFNRVMQDTSMSVKQGLCLDRGIRFELVPRLTILREVVESWENETIFKRETTMEQKDSCVSLRMATNALFMAFLVVHDVCYVKGR